MLDVIIIGGSNAGLSAALVLGRARRRVVVLDHEQPRNAPSPGVHNFLSRDGILPAELRRIGREQLRAYEGVEVRIAEATDAQPIDGGFVVTLVDGVQLQARKLVLATGVYDEPLSIEGFAEHWGASIFHCPYCHGWEVRDEPLAIYGNGTVGVEMAQTLHGWSHDLVLCTNGPATLTPDERQRLARNGVAIREDTIVRFEGENGALRRIYFAAGEPLERHGMFVHLPQRQRSSLPAVLGCAEIGEGPYPHVLKVDAMGLTSVSGVYAAGDMATVVQQAILAAGSGLTVAASINRSFLAEEFV